MRKPIGLVAFFERIPIANTKPRLPALLAVAALPAAFLCASPSAWADPILGPTVDTFAVLGGGGITNAGSATVSGNIGTAPSAVSTITGFPPGVVTGGVITTTAVAQQAQGEALTAYNYVAGLTPTTNLTGVDLGGLTLTPGVYGFSSSAQLTGILTLNAEGIDNATFIFQIGSMLTTASDSIVSIINGGPGDGVFWQVGSSATLGDSSLFEGNILADTSIGLDPSAQIGCGRALAGIVLTSGSVTMAGGNSVTIDDGSSCVGGLDSTGSVAGGGVVPEPGSLALLLAGLLGLAATRVPRRPKPRFHRLEMSL